MEKITKVSHGMQDSDVVCAVQEVIGTWLTEHGLIPFSVTAIRLSPAITLQGTRAFEVEISLEPLEENDALLQQKELDRTFNLGISAGLERAAKRLMDQAAKAFTFKDDETARALRIESLAMSGFAKEIQDKQEVSHE